MSLCRTSATSLTLPPDLLSVLGLFFNHEGAHLLCLVVIATQWENSCDAPITETTESSVSSDT